MAITINPNESLIIDNQMVFANGRAIFVFQSDGNLVLYVRRPGSSTPIARWASGTHGKPITTCIMQGDGNLVLYDANGTPHWSSGTYGHAGAVLALQDDENVVIYNPQGQAVWSTNTWVSGWQRCGFDFRKSGLRFGNSFTDANIASIPLAGLCGGMTYTALDYHYYGRHAPRLKQTPSTEHNPLGNYIKARHIQSLVHMGAVITDLILIVLGIPIPSLAGAILGGVPNYNLQQYLLLQTASDADLRKRSFDDEFYKIKNAIDTGKPVAIGLMSKDGGLTNNHQLIAFGYRDGVHDRWIEVFDQNHPNRTGEIWISADQYYRQNTGEVWRGLFLEEYSPAPPPFLGIYENIALEHRVFNALFYLSIYNDLQNAFGSNTQAAQTHWLQYGIFEGRRASQVFDPSYYLNGYGDLINAFGADNFESAIEHWINHGINEGRRSSLEFDVAWYLQNHPDLVNAFGANNYAAAIDHWFNHGLKEGRRSSADFDVNYYLNSHSDLVNAFGANNYTAAFTHWLQYGKSEGRKPIP